MSNAPTLGIDIGGSGSRAIVHGTEGIRVIDGPRVQIQPDGVANLAKDLIETVGVQPRAIGLGATGMGTLVPDPQALADELASGGARVTVAIDAVTAHLGALGGRPGAVIALGTGAIALGWDGGSRWRRVDGWGHLLGDRGGGAWLGQRGFAAAIRAFDGIDESGQALLERARQQFGEPQTWPSQIYFRSDRAGVLASFATAVVRLAESGDQCAAALVTKAGIESARSAASALGPQQTAVAGTGGMFRPGELLVDSFRRELARIRPDAELTDARGGSLEGALRLAASDLPSQPGYIWRS